MEICFKNYQKIYSAQGNFPKNILTSGRRTTSNQSSNTIVYINVEIFNVQQQRINVACFNNDIKRCYFQRRELRLCFDVDQNMTIYVWKEQENIFEL